MKLRLQFGSDGFDMWHTVVTGVLQCVDMEVISTQEARAILFIEEVTK